MSQTEIRVVHETIDLPVPYAAFTRRLERLLGRFDPEVAERVLSEDPTAAAARIGAMAGDQGLMLFGAQDHGGLFALRGEARKAKRFHVGNPLIAFQMTQQDIRAGLYAPLTMLVYEGALEHEHLESRVRLGSLNDGDQIADQFGPQEIHGRGRKLYEQNGPILAHLERVENHLRVSGVHGWLACSRPKSPGSCNGMAAPTPRERAPRA
jgi:hypothetical protein